MFSFNLHKRFLSNSYLGNVYHLLLFLGTKRPRGSGRAEGKTTGKRPSTNLPNNRNNADDDSDREVDPSTFDIDPDEPRYCLCDQVILMFVFYFFKQPFDGKIWNMYNFNFAIFLLFLGILWRNDWL